MAESIPFSIEHFIEHSSGSGIQLIGQTWLQEQGIKVISDTDKICIVNKIPGESEIFQMCQKRKEKSHSYPFSKLHLKHLPPNKENHSLNHYEG